MADDTTQRAAHKFLREHLQSQQPFTKEDFRQATGWEKSSTFNTYFSKQFKPLFEKISADKFRVSETFRKFVSWPKFKQHVTQVRRVVTSYEPSSSKVMIYDFLMPLTNEAHLRTTLDALFFKDSLIARLKTIGVPELKQHLKFDDAPADQYLESVLAFIENHFVGYSVFHVDGRFRSGQLRTQDEVADIQKQGEKYLIDETTAVARFIFPYKDEDELQNIRYLFGILFVRSIIQLVNGEEQIWMIETGPENKVHIWASLADVEGGEDEEQEEA
ncbi:MAG: hypothetical protein ACLQDV_07145 [Candidatus Binataceae bacterium]